MPAQGRDWTEREPSSRHNRKTESGTRSERFAEKVATGFPIGSTTREGLEPFRDSTNAGRLCRAETRSGKGDAR